MFPRAGRPFDARRDGALAAAGLAALIAFAGSAWAVSAGRAEPFDRAALALLQRLASPSAEVAMRAVTLAGSVPAVLAVVAFALWFHLRRGAGRASFQLAAVAATGEIANLVLKQVFHRVRPPHAQLESYSFPSGHAMTAVVTYGMLALLVARAAPRFRLPAALAGSMLAILVGCSRVYLGLHWASDVVAGFAAGSLVLAISAWATSPGLDPGGPC